MGDQLYDDLLVELECPICTNYMSPPIRQCATGHNVCASCHKQLQKCALCQGKFYESRNLALEALAVKMRYPCINSDAGCTARLSYMEKETHELQCNVKEFKRPTDLVGTSEKIGVPAEVLVEHDKDSAASSNVIPTNSKDTTGIRQCRVVYSYQQEQEDELNLNIGDIIDIMGVEEEGWWRGVLNGREGVFASYFVEEITAATTKSTSDSRDILSGFGNLNLGPSPVLPSKPTKTVCQVIFPYNAQRDGELTLRVGDLVTLLSKDDQEPGWWRGELNWMVGIFPKHFVTVVPINASTTSTATVTLADRLKAEKEPRLYTDIFNLYTPPATVTSPNRKSLMTGQIGGTKPDLGPVRTTPAVPGKEPFIPIKKLPSNGGGYGDLFVFGLKKNVNVVDGATDSKAVVSPPKVETNNNNNNNYSKNPFDCMTGTLLIPRHKYPWRETPAKTVCQVRFPYKALRDGDLTLREGDLVTLLSEDGEDPGWWKGKLNGVVGVFHKNFVTVVPINAFRRSTATMTLADRLKYKKKPRPHTDIFNLYTPPATVTSQNRMSLVTGQIGGMKPNLGAVKITPAVPGKEPFIPIKKLPSNDGGSRDLFVFGSKKNVNVVDGATDSKAVVSPPKVETNNNNNYYYSKNQFHCKSKRRF